MLAHVENRITYSGNGNATEFAYQFKILDRTDIKVMLTDADGKEKLLTKDYYVDVEKSVVRYPGYAVGEEVPESERPAVLPTGWKLTIYREVPVTQETDLPDQYPFNQVEAIGDKLTMIAQQLTDTTGRSLKIGVSKSTDIDTVIPWENGKSFRISDDGKTLELSEDPAKVLPLAQGVYTQTQAQAQSAAASAAAAAKSEDSAFESAGVAGNSAQYASLSAASAAENAELTSGYKQEALTAKADATASATNAKASEANAKISENNAEASKEAAQSAATTASNFANASRSSANEARTYKDNAKTYMDNAKNYSENVNVFIPSVSAAGVLSWTNRAGLDNPANVNIKGAKGDKGDTGAQGIQGVKGDKGDKGDTGAQGLQGVKGDKGDKGDTGAQGLQGVKGDKGDKGDTGAQGLKGDKGDKGDTGATGAPGAAASIRIGSVVTGAPGTDVVVSNSGTSTNAILNFTIPRGNPGADGGVTVDEVLNATSLNPIANKTVYAALQEKVTAEEIADTYAKKSDVSALLSTKLGVTATAYAATRDGAGNNIADTYAKKTDITNITVDAELSDTSTNPVQNKVVKTNMDALYNNLITRLNAYRSEIPTKVSALENDAGYLTQHQSLDGYAKTSVANTWTAQQNFHDLMLYREKYTTYVVNGTSDTPITSTMLYTAVGSFTLNLSTLAGALSAGQSSVFTAYFAANADYSLTITNAGTLKYIGSASDVAITSAGLLLNILMLKDNSGNVTSIVQASKLS